MMPSLIQVVIGLGTLGAFLLLFYGPWQWVCTDIARQVVFEKRDAIFDLGASGRVELSSREYATIRSALQDGIRFAHDLTLPSFVILGVVVWLRGGFDADRGRIEQAIDRIPNRATRAKVQELVDDAYRALLLMMLVRSLWVVALLPLVVFVAFFGNAARVFVQLASRLIQVEAEGLPSEARARAA